MMCDTSSSVERTNSGLSTPDINAGTERGEEASSGAGTLGKLVASIHHLLGYCARVCTMLLKPSSIALRLGRHRSSPIRGIEDSRNAGDSSLPSPELFASTRLLVLSANSTANRSASRPPNEFPTKCALSMSWVSMKSLTKRVSSPREPTDSTLSQRPKPIRSRAYTR